MPELVEEDALRPAANVAQVQRRHATPLANVGRAPRQPTGSPYGCLGMCQCTPVPMPHLQDKVCAALVHHHRHVTILPRPLKRVSHVRACIHCARENPLADSPLGNPSVAISTHGFFNLQEGTSPRGEGRTPRRAICNLGTRENTSWKAKPRPCGLR